MLFSDFVVIEKLLSCYIYVYVCVCFSSVFLKQRSQDSTVGIATGYRLDDQRVRVQVPVGSRIFSSPSHPDRFWGPPSLLSNGYWRLFPQGKSDRGVKLTTYLWLVPRSRKCGSLHPLPPCLHGISVSWVKHRDNFTLPYF
jgi:hypothetical protein